MKKIVCILFILFETMMIAQTDELPSKVSDSFAKKYKNAQNISWYDDDQTIVIDFDLGKEYLKALFSKDGEWIETRRRIENEYFPSKIVKAIISKYPSIQLVNGDFVETREGSKFYRFFGYTAENDFTINISTDGKILNPIN